VTLITYRIVIKFLLQLVKRTELTRHFVLFKTVFKNKGIQHAKKGKNIKGTRRTILFIVGLMLRSLTTPRPTFSPFSYFLQISYEEFVARSLQSYLILQAFY